MRRLGTEKLPADVTYLYCPLSADEEQVVADLIRAGGFSSAANMMRSALWSLADHMQLEMPNGVFDQRSKPGNTANLHKGRDAYHAAMREEPQELPLAKPVRIKPKRSAANHPWRGPDGLMS